MRQSDRIARLVFSALGLLLLGIGGNLIIDFVRLSVRMSSSRQVNATVVRSSESANIMGTTRCTRLFMSMKTAAR